LLLQDFMELDRGHPAAPERVEAGAVLLEHLKEPTRRRRGLGRSFLDTLKKEI
jgi:hypothetical protein